MRQVPQKNTYLLVGDGRLAAHWSHYFDLLNVPILKWSRSNNPNYNTFCNIENSGERLLKSAEECTHVLLAISDKALPEIVTQLPQIKTLIHFSGAMSLPRGFGAHPLMTFSHELYDLDFYKQIPFVVDRKQNDTLSNSVIPEWENPIFLISQEDKALYHALCVFSGNFTNLLWRETFKLFDSELGLPPQILKNYLISNLNNILQDPLNSLTGPLTRKDSDTLAANEKALRKFHLDSIYSEFVKLYERETLKEKSL